MKITLEHYGKLATAIQSVLDSHPGIQEAYYSRGLSAMRLNWDLLRASRIDGVPGIEWICLHIYPYADDTHVGTALKQIVGNDGRNSDGKLR